MPVFSQLRVNQLKNPVWVYDTTRYGVFWANQAALELWESDCLEELKQRDFKSGTSSAVQETLLGYLEDFRCGAVVDRWWQISPQGIDKKIFCRFSGIEVEPGRIAMLVEAQDSELLQGNGSDHYGTALVALFDQMGELVSCNPPFSQAFGQNFDCFKQQFGAETTEILQRRIDSGAWDRILNSIEGRRWHTVEIKLQQKKNAETPHYIVSLVDIHERKLRELQHATASLTDSLTGLLNRRGIEDRLSRIKQSRFSVFYIDLDNFKAINDTYGHGAGDILLKHIANILQNDIDTEAVSGRLGGDEFLLFIPRYLNSKELRACSKTIMQRLSEAVDVDDQWQLSVSASVGIAQAPRDGKQLQELLVCADAAMYAAKHQGRSRSIRYVRGMEEQFHRRTVIVKDLEVAADSNQLHLLYQTIESYQMEKPVLVEAFLRWQHPELGEITPEELAAAAQESGHIATLECWVLDRVCQDLAELQRYFGENIKVSINISAGFLNSGEFGRRIESILKDHQDCTRHLLIELEEDSFVKLMATASPVLEDARRLGIGLCVDGFGGGLSSLPYLESSAVAYIKLHQRFIQAGHAARVTLGFIAELCAELDINHIATGIEKQDQRELLHSAGFDFQQGYYYSAPKPLTEIKSMFLVNSE